MSIQNVKVDDYEKSTTAYFKSIRNNKPLTKKEEQMLWKRYHEKKDTNARNLLIQANLKFVPTIAKQFKGCGLPFAEIIQEGNIGLIQAIDKFDYKKDTKVISYAVWWIRKTIMEAIEKKSVLNTENIDDFAQNETKNENTQYLERNFIYDYSSNDMNEVKQILEELFDGISEKERYMISDYYGLDGCGPKTLEEIGEEFNLTKERVRQINEKSLTKMRSNAIIKNIHFTGFN